VSQVDSIGKSLLVEIGTEELPPKSLDKLRLAFEKELGRQLKQHRLDYSGTKSYATPRRLALVVEGLAESQPDESIELLGPAKAAAFDAEGAPTQAALGFARKCGVSDVSELGFIETDKVERLAYSENRTGQKTEALLAEIIEIALGKLPIAKRMRWGAGRQEFVRPVHWIVLLFGTDPVTADIMGISAGNKTRGHRFHSNNWIEIESAQTYQDQLKAAKVIVDMEERSNLIVEQVNQLAKKSAGTAVISPGILQEVTALVEWPVALCGRFDEAFLEVPEEALISSMGEHQKYFHLVDSADKLLPLFITVSNIESSDPSRVIDGNERVIRPRLADAKFFYDTDLKTTLDKHKNKLEKIVFQADLGSLADKSARVGKLGQYLADSCGADSKLVARAAELAKCDLVTDMVQEFDHLQGTMGRYYAIAMGEPAQVAEAIYEQYLPKQAGGALPKTPTGVCLALAERLDTLTGIFGINQPPTGSRDPFALRRASLGVLNILVDNQIQLDLGAVVGTAYDSYDKLPVERAELIDQVRAYLIDRFRAWFEDEGTAVEIFRAVRQVEQNSPYEIYRRVQAMRDFAGSEAASSLAATNKRVANILAKADLTNLPDLNAALFEDKAESALAAAVEQSRQAITPALQSGDFSSALAAMASLQLPLEAFFESVMVMAEDKNLRLNRLSLLNQVRQLVLLVADLTELGG
jgi:glycyl-tRNA synthetase beta chain